MELVRSAPHKFGEHISHQMCSNTFDASNAPVRFDERDVETEHGWDSEAPANERAGYRQAKPKPPRHISTLQEALLMSKDSNKKEGKGE